MYIEKVQSDRRRAIICKAAPERLPSMMAKVGLVMSPHVVEAIKVESQPFLARYEEVLKKMAEVKALDAEKIETIKRLKLYVRHSWSVLDKRVLRGEIKAHDLPLYGARKGSKWEQASTYTQWISAARDLVRGERIGIEKGIEPLSEPKAFELETLYKHARKLIARADSLSNDLLELEHQQRPVRKELNQLINELRKMIVLETRNNTTVWRVLLRAAGYNIRYHKQTKEEEHDADGKPVKHHRKRKTNNPFFRREKNPKLLAEILDDLLQKAREHHRAIARGEEVGPLELPEKSALRRRYKATLPEPEEVDLQKLTLPKIPQKDSDANQPPQ